MLHVLSEIYEISKTELLDLAICFAVETIDDIEEKSFEQLIAEWRVLRAKRECIAVASEKKAA